VWLGAITFKVESSLYELSYDWLWAGLFFILVVITEVDLRDKMEVDLRYKMMNSSKLKNSDLIKEKCEGSVS
jgi:hypothetical protein